MSMRPWTYGFDSASECYLMFVLLHKLLGCLYEGCPQSRWPTRSTAIKLFIAWSDIIMTSHVACTSGTSRVLTVASLKRLKMEALSPAPIDYEVRSVIKVLNAQSIAPIEILRQLSQESFPADLPLLVAQNIHGAPVIQKVECAKANETSTQSKAHGVCIDNCSPSFLTLQEITVWSVSAFSVWRRGGDECHTIQWCQSQTADFYNTGTRKLVPWCN